MVAVDVVVVSGTLWQATNLLAVVVMDVMEQGSDGKIENRTRLKTVRNWDVKFVSNLQINPQFLSVRDSGSALARRLETAGIKKKTDGSPGFLRKVSATGT